MPYFRMSKWPQGSRLASAANKEKFYHQVASAAESGWDFSSQWMRFGCATGSAICPPSCF